MLSTEQALGAFCHSLLTVNVEPDVARVSRRAVPTFVSACAVRGPKFPVDPVLRNTGRRRLSRVMAVSECAIADPGVRTSNLAGPSRRD